jgi:hypothetical protein
MLIYVVINVIWGLRIYDKSQTHTHIFQQHVICVYTRVVKMVHPRPVLGGGFEGSGCCRFTLNTEGFISISELKLCFSQVKLRFAKTKTTSFIPVFVISDVNTICPYVTK